MPIELAIAGIGKIARDQHVPAVAANHDYRLVATMSRHGSIQGVTNFPTMEAMLASGQKIEAISFCTPPDDRFAMAAVALEAGLHVMLEKPPAATLGEAQALVSIANRKGVTLFATWHSRCAAAVAPARRWLLDRKVNSVRIDWLENIREWHPGQDWILAAGGFGVFDPGINALSILTSLLPDRVRIERSVLQIPQNRMAPIAAELWGQVGAAPLSASFDFLHSGTQCWTIRIETDNGTLLIEDGGASAMIDGTSLPGDDAHGEYPTLYCRFAELIAAGQSDVDLEPIRIVADSWLRAEFVRGKAFEF